jgi:nitrate/nitrite-specific signal transduction histidine kinase
VNDRITLTVKDDGLGLLKSLGESNGMGLHIMNYRARMIGATLEVRRDGDGGTAVTCSFQNTAKKGFLDGRKS